MKKIILVSLLSILIGVGTAFAASAWRIKATSVDDTYASVHVEVAKTNALALRAYGKDLELSGSLNCDLPEINVASGQVVPLVITKMKSCTIYASADHRNLLTNGLIKLQVLAH